MKFFKRLAAFFVAFAAVAVLALGGVWYLIEHKLNKIEKIDDATLDIIAPEDEYFETDEIFAEPETEAGDVVFEDETDSENNEGDAGSDTDNVGEESDGLDEETHVLEETLAPTEPKEIVVETVEKINTEGLVNILLVGQDRREGEGRQRSDSMIMCSINPETGEISLISFLRDLYVNIPGGYSNNRLNTPYIFGGFKLLNRTLEANFGISADHNIEVDFEGFIKIVDVVGGINMELTKKEAEIVGGGAVEGENRLNGAQALTYARIRKIDSDFSRTQRQRKVLLAMFDEIKNLPAAEIWALIDEITPLITTDMENSEIISLALKLIPNITNIKISQYSVPKDGMYYEAVVKKMMVLVPDTVKIRDTIEKKYLPF